MPTLLLTYANSDTHKLPTLTEEYDKVNEALSIRFANGDFVVVSEPFTTRDKIKDLIHNHGRNLCLFLYSGHADRDALIFEDGSGYFEGIAGMLAKCPLIIVILNGCSTVNQVNILRERGIPIIIATSAPVEDITATKFSISFFQALSNERLTIREAFQQAVDVVKTFKRTIEVEITSRGLGSMPKEIPLWGIYYDQKREFILDFWRLGEALPVLETGKIINDIPSKMEINKRKIYKIRIAKNEENLLRNFNVPDDRIPDSIEISKTMEIALVDGDGGAFKIELILPNISNPIQPIKDYTYTEWLFAVTPLKKGQHVLILCAYIIEKIDGEKTKRVLTFEKEVIVTNKEKRSSNKEILAEYIVKVSPSNTVILKNDIIIEKTNLSENSIIFATNLENLSTKLTMMLVILLLTSIGYILYHLNIKNEYFAIMDSRNDIYSANDTLAKVLEEYTEKYKGMGVVRIDDGAILKALIDKKEKDINKLESVSPVKFKDLGFGFQILESFANDESNNLMISELIYRKIISSNFDEKKLNFDYFFSAHGLATENVIYKIIWFNSQYKPALFLVNSANAIPNSILEYKYPNKIYNNRSGQLDKNYLLYKEYLVPRFRIKIRKKRKKSNQKIF